jgi:hypothetical protein
MTKPATRQTRTPRERAQSQLDVATRLVSRLEKKANVLRIEAAAIDRELRDAEARRLYLSKHPDLGDAQ